MSTEAVDSRLHRLQDELAAHARVARHLGLDFERPIRALGDGYPENTVALVGKITERLLKQLWNHHDVAGDPSNKALNDLIKGCRPFIADGPRLRRAGRDGSGRRRSRARPLA